MAGKGYPQDEIESAISRLSAASLLDDSRFALEYARQRLVNGRESPRRTVQALLAKGIAAPAARKAVDEVVESEEVDLLESLREAADRKTRQLAGLPPDVQRRRLFAFLARKGFSLEDIRRLKSDPE